MTDDITRANIYAGEAQLLRWGDGPKGRTITLLIDPECLGEHPFRAEKCGEANGQRMTIVCVRLSDEDQPQAKAEAPRQVTNEPVPVKKARNWRDMPRSQQAALSLRSTAFIDWLAEAYPNRWYAVQAEEDGNTPVDDMERADRLLKSIIGIASKSELDTNGYKAAAWDKLKTDFDVRGMQR